jgi:virginiamycin B lyase
MHFGNVSVRYSSALKLAKRSGSFGWQMAIKLLYTAPALTLIAVLLLTAPLFRGAEQQPTGKAVEAPFSGLKTTATFNIGKNADWVAMADDSVWVAGTEPFTVQRINPKLNTITAKVALPGEACSGLLMGFHSVWVPLCGKPNSLARVDAGTNKLALLPLGPAGEEGGIAASRDSIWLISDDAGTLNRIDPRSNTVRQKVQVPAGSYNPIYSRGKIWITTPQANSVTAVNASSGAVIRTVPVGPQPRFLTAGGGSIWILNQGDGTITRVEENALTIKATIAAGIPGKGGDIAYGAGSVWATVFGTPLVRIDAGSNRIVRRWTGPGGDSLRVGFHSIWITDYRKGLLQRIPLAEATRRER